MKQLNILFCSAGEQEVAEEEAGEGIFLKNIYTLWLFIGIYYPCRLSLIHNPQLYTHFTHLVLQTSHVAPFLKTALTALSRKVTKGQIQHKCEGCVMVCQHLLSMSQLP